MTTEKEKNITRREFLDKSVKTTAAVAMTGSLFTLTPGCGRTSDTDYDLLIKNGTVYDGTLNKPYTADIGIREDKIIAIGKLTQKAVKTIDATGKMVTPGFIDVHTHCDLTFERGGIKRFLAYAMPSWKGNHNYQYQGVTTVVTGNCGYGYTDMDQWFDMVESVGFGTNVYTLVPHGMIREALFGKDQPQKLSLQQLESMKSRVSEEMEKGAIGMSTGLEYAPGYLAKTSELIELSKVVRQHGGIFTTHMRDESGKIYPDGDKGIFKSVKETIKIGREAEIPVQISHLKISAPINETRAREVLDLIENARYKGLDITADQYPYAAGFTMLSHLLPNEMKTSTSVKDKYKTKAGQQEIITAMADVFKLFPPEKTMIAVYEGNSDYEGKTIKEIAEIEGRSASESYADMVCEEKLPAAIYFFQDMNIVKDLTPYDYVMTASDGWTVPKGMTKPHPRVYGTFPRKLKKFVLDEKLMGLPAAIRSMTSLPAEKFKMKGRGKIEKGYFADIAVLDQNSITDRATYTDPHQYGEGVVHLIVNGVVSIENSRTTKERGGRAIRCV
jgi:N-acyl-D-amino-acid deacylase